VCYELNNREINNKKHIHTIMALANMCCSNSSSIFVGKISDNHQGNWTRCTELSLELQKVRIEMLSYEKIIKMLQEELYKKELAKNTESSEEEYVSTRFKAQPLKEDWSQVTSKKYRKEDDSGIWLYPMILKLTCVIMCLMDSVEHILL
jgi:hypothetical protein